MSDTEFIEWMALHPIGCSAAVGLFEEQSRLYPGETPEARILRFRTTVLLTVKQYAKAGL